MKSRFIDNISTKHKHKYNQYISHTFILTGQPVDILWNLRAKILVTIHHGGSALKLEARRAEKTVKQTHTFQPWVFAARL